MIEAVMLWNEPNNLSHWDFHEDPEWKIFAEMTLRAAAEIRRHNPAMKLVLGGISPVDAGFIRHLDHLGVIEAMDVVAIHGFPLDWNHWPIHDWPRQVKTIENACGKPVWVTEAGASSFGAEEVQVFGLHQTARHLLGHVARIHWYSLLDLPPGWDAATRHKESEGSAYYRHYYMGLVRASGGLKLAYQHFPAGMGICQWFHFEDPRLGPAVERLRELGVKHLRTGLSWADWFRPRAEAWFDRQVRALEEFELTLTLCFTPEHLGRQPHHTSPPRRPEDFAAFAGWVAERYLSPARKQIEAHGPQTPEFIEAGAHV